MRKGMRVIAFAMAFILTFTTLVSDTSMMTVNAEETTTDTSGESNETKVEESLGEQGTQEGQSSSEEPGSIEPTTEEAGSDTEATTVEEVTTGETATEEMSIEEVTTEEMSTEEVTTEDMTTEEVKIALIQYEATKGGSVSKESEEIELIDGAVAEGAIASADQGYKFVNWTKDGEEVSTSPTFVPENLEDATYVANFKIEEVKKPEMTLSKIVNGVKIVLHAPAGTLSEGAELVVNTVTVSSVKDVVESEVTSENREVTEMKAFDIKIKDAEGNTTQPEGDVYVTFENVSFDAEVIEVYHVDDNKQSADKMEDVKVNDNTVEMTTDHFSIYVVAGSDYADNTSGIYVNGRLVATSRDNPYKMYTGETIILSTDKNNADWTRSWNYDISNDNQYVAISKIEYEYEQGRIKALKVKPDTSNNGVIKLKYKSYSGASSESFYVKVLAKPTIAVTSVTASTDKDTLLVGQTAQGTATVVATPDTSENKAVLWSSLDTNIATVNAATGKITAVAAGTTTIKVVSTVDSSKFDSFTVTVVAQHYNVTFNKNGASGSNFVLESDDSGAINMPDPTENGITREGYIFVGWSSDRDGTGNNYAINEQIDIKKSITLYAIWLEDNSTGNQAAEYYVRLDGQVPYEPSGYESSKYTDKIDGTIYKAIAINNNLSAVQKNLKSTPSDSQIKNKLQEKGISYNSSTQYIEWYVIKKTGTWHVDGVLRNKNMNAVRYDANGGNNSVMPAGIEAAEGTTVTVDFEHNPTRAGYTFLGWDTNNKATSPSYTINGTKTFSMGSSDVTLYAIWKANDNTAFTVNHYVSEDGQYPDSATYTEIQYGKTDSTVYDVDYVKIIPGYTHTEDKTVSTVITADGLGILNIYYDKDASQWATLSYDGNTATSQPGGGIETVSYIKGTKVTLVSVTDMLENQYFAKEGYTFDGWTLTEGTDSVSSQDKVTQVTLNNNMVVRATWLANEANYMVEHYLQNSDTVTYPATASYSESKTGTVGTTVYDADYAKEYEGYFYKADAVSSEVVKADSKTVLKLYYPLLNKVRVTGNTVTYDGQKHSIKAASPLRNGSTVYYTTNPADDNSWSQSAPNYTEVGIYTIYVKATNPDYPDTAVASGTVVINKREITVTAGSASKVYNKLALTKNFYVITSRMTGITDADAVVSGQTKEVFVSGSQTEVGSSANTVSSVAIKSGKTDVTANYDIKTVNGTLTVTKAEGAGNGITVARKEVYYDGMSHQIDAATADEADSTVSYSTDGKNYSATIPTATEAGTTKIYVKAENKNYKDAIAETELLIKQRPITVTAGSDTKKYNGTALTKNVYSVTGGIEGEAALASGQKETVRVSGTQTNVGNSDNKVTSVVIKADRTDVTKNYAISKVNGTLEVTKADADKNVIDAKGFDKLYDGVAEKLEKATATKGSSISYQVNGGAFSTEVPKFTEAGTYTVTVKAENENYEDATKVVTVIIRKRAITVTADSDTQVYDGTALVKATAVITGDGIAKNQAPDITVSGSQTEVGSSDNTVTEVTIKAGETEVTKNYSINKVKGILEVTKAPATDNEITAEGFTRIYDGTTTSLQEATAKATDSTISYKVDNGVYATELPSFTEAGTYKVTVKAVNKNYEDAIKEVTVTINKRSILVTADSATRVYDGSALTKDTVTITGDGMAENQKAEVSIAGTQTNVGSSANIVTGVVIKAGNTDVTANYKIDVANGILEVTKKGIKITALPQTKVYGEADPVFIYEKVEGIVGEDDLKITMLREDGENVGTYTLTPKIVNENYQAEVIPAELTITARPITFTAASASRRDGSQALTANSYTISEGSLATVASQDNVSSIAIVGSQDGYTIGTSANVISNARMANAAGEDMTGNYTISYINGTLTIYGGAGTGTNAVIATTPTVLGAARTIPEGEVLGATRTIEDDPTALAATPEGEVLGADRPQTGDTANVYAYFIAILASTGVLTGWVIRRKKHENQ